jgi:pilus assembly protein Flp/PilA
MSAAFVRLFRDCSGATALEYAIIASLVSIALVAGATVIGTRLNDMLGGVSSHLN